VRFPGAAKKREANHSRLHAGEQQYAGGRDRLFPDEATPEDMVAVA